MEEARVQKNGDKVKQTPKAKSPSQIIGGWTFSEGSIQEEAYRLWESGHSIDAETNWFEAERRISNSLSN
jgi:hypothetical protein